MSFLVKQPALPQTDSAEQQLGSGYREADTVGMGFGRDPWPSHWICDAYNRHTAPHGQQPEWQYASIAAVYRTGVLKRVGRVYMNGKEIDNLDYSFGAEEDEHEFVLNERLASGRAFKFILRRGSETQQASAALSAATGQDHPAYRGLIWAEWQNIDLGKSTAIPMLALELEVETPDVDAYGAGSSNPYGVNPFAAIWAFATDPKGGLGDDGTVFDPVHWGAQAAALEATGIGQRLAELVHCHPMITDQQDAATFFSAILAYVDGYMYADGDQWKVGWFPHNSPAGALPEITEHDLDAKPTGNGFADANNAPSDVVVVYREPERRYMEAPASYSAHANTETGILPTPVRKQRPWCHDAGQGAIIAAELSAESRSSPNDDGATLSVLQSRALRLDSEPLMPGDLFDWDYAPHSRDLTCRVVSRRMRSGKVSDVLTVIRERGQFPRPYVAAVDPRVLPGADEPGEITEADVRMWLLPTELSASRKVAALINRAKRSIYRADIHLSVDGSAPWDVIQDSRFFVAKVTLNGAIDDDDASVTIDTTSVDWERMQEQTTVAQADDVLLLLCENELMSVSTIAAVDADTFTLGIARGRRGTTAAAHADDAVGWVFYRSEVQNYAVEHQEWYRVRDGSNVYDAGIATKYFKLQLATISAEGLAKPDDPGIDLQLPDVTEEEVAAAGFTILLTSYTHAVAAAADGTVLAGQLGASGTARTTVLVYDGSTALTAVASSPGAGQFAISIGTLTNATATKESDDTVRCDTLTADAGAIAISVDVEGAFTITKRFTLAKVRAGTNGTNGTNGSNGSNGTDGEDGRYVERRYRRSTLVPATPSGTNPASWTTAIPSGTDALWVSEALKEADGTLVGSWSTPQRLSGNIIFYQDSAPTTGTHTLLEGDLWFDTDGGNRPHRWENPGSGFQWVAKPFGDAAIANLAAGKITAGTITSAIEIVSPKISGGGLYIDSAIGMRYIDDAGVLTITGGGSNGAAHGAQIDMVGNDHATTSIAGVLVLAAGDVTSGNIRFRTDDTERGTVHRDGRLMWNEEIWPDDDVVFDGTQKVRFDSAGTLVSYIDESYGLQLHGDATHPVHIRSCALVFGATAGGSFTAGRIYDANGDQILREQYSTAAPADATDEASAISLANWLKALALHHGLGTS